MNIVTDQEKLKKQTCPVNPVNPVSKIAAELFKTMKEYNGQGLAANQIGYDLQIFVMKRENYSPICLVNPVITSRKGNQRGPEGCLSIPGITKMVTRPYKIRVKGFNQYFVPVSYSFTGIESRRACHEIDHLNGKLIIDYE